MKTYKVTYLNAARKVENSVMVQARSLEAAIEEEKRMVEVMNRTNPFISLKSVVEVA
jgi:hypothetical protein